MAGKQEKFLIITADDFGYSEERDDGIVDCFMKGAISNVSLMVNGYSVETAVKKAQAVGLPMGLHLNLTEGSPVSTPAPKTLLGSDGFMHGMFGCREAFSQGLINTSEVVAEIQAQIDKFEQLTGSKPVNVDGHQHIHCFPGICEILAGILQNNGIKLTRLPIESDLDSSNYREFFEEVVHQAESAENIFLASGVSAPGFTGLNTMSKDMNTERLQKYVTGSFKTKYSKQHYINNGRPTCELMVHPGKQTGNYGGCGNGPDDFSQSADRVHEMGILLSENMKHFYQKSNIKLVSFNF